MSASTPGAKSSQPTRGSESQATVYEGAAELTSSDKNARLARLPSVERVMGRADVMPLIDEYGHSLVVESARKTLDDWRQRALASAAFDVVPAMEHIAAHLACMLAANTQSAMRSVFNLTGTVLHTNLGRALLPEDAVGAVVAAISQPVNLEFDLSAGRRGERDDLVADLLRDLAGAQAATVVNNNAAAVLLVLCALASKKEVIVSRGELIEIGGSFRIPDIMTGAGAKLREVGTTNRTHLADYEEAIGPRTALAMKVHCSNYAIRGFSKSVTLAELVPMAHAHDVPVVVDLGSGTLVDLAQWGLPREPTVRETLASGADVVTFSGDKLLGGPQAGLIVGRADLIAKIKRHPLKRALRVGKLTLAALEAVLRLYRSPERLAQRLTTLRLLTRSADEIRACAERTKPALQDALGDAYAVSVEPMRSQIGSGALPVDLLPSHGLVVRAVSPKKRSGRALVTLEAQLRAWPRPVLGRIEDDALRLDMRCLETADETAFIAQCREQGA